MDTVRDPLSGVLARVQPCKVCGQSIYFGLTAKGKRNPYDLDAGGVPTRVSHFTTCPKVREWTASHPKQERAG